MFPKTRAIVTLTVCIVGLGGLCSTIFILKNAENFMESKILDNRINCYDQEEDYRCQLTSKTAYRYVANYNTSSPSYPGCQPKKIWAFVRHGGRFTTASALNKMIKYLPSIQSRIIENFDAGKSKLSKEIVDRLKEWTISNQEKLSPGEITEQGEAEMLEFAERMRIRYREVFEFQGNSTYKFLSEEKKRSEDSAKVIAKGLFGSWKDDRLLWNSTDQEFMVTHFPYKCQRWYQEVINDPATLLEREKFFDSQLFKNVTLNISDKIGFNLTYDEIRVLYDRCKIESAAEFREVVPWCELFTLDQLKIHNFAGDLEYYYNDGYPHEINYKPACKAFVDLVDFFTSESNLRMKFYVSHTPVLLKILTLLGMFEDQTELTHQSFSFAQNSRKWRLSKIAGFSTNMMFTLYDCETIGKSITFSHQERILEIPGCPENKPCPLSKFIELFPTTEDRCNYEEMCRIDH